MVKKFSKLQNIKGNYTDFSTPDCEFLHQLENSLLLALKELGQLDAMQYRHAAEKLKQGRNIRLSKYPELSGEI